MQRNKLPNGWMFHLTNDSSDPRDQKILSMLDNRIHRIEVIYKDGKVTVNGYEYEASANPIMILEGLPKGYCKPLIEFIKAFSRRNKFYSKASKHWITYDVDFRENGNLHSVEFYGYPSTQVFIVYTRGARRTFDQCVKYAEKNWKKHFHD